MFPVVAPPRFHRRRDHRSSPSASGTEVGLVGVDVDGDAVRVSEWASLVNPGVPIPAEIQWLTGITNAMVRDAPSFSELAQDLYDRLDGAVFVAHNARFDYGFLRAEFAGGLNFHAKTLCRCALWHLYPDRAPHTLDAIIERFGLAASSAIVRSATPRSLAPAAKLAERHPPAALELAVATLLRRPSLPAHLPPDALDGIPHAPGVYLFYGLNEHPIYIGKSVDLRSRVAGHFNSEHRATRELRLSQEVHRLEWEETAGELGALLREGELIKSAARAQRRAASQAKPGAARRRRAALPEGRQRELAPFGSVMVRSDRARRRTHAEHARQ
jgi:DNA polymerase-3 subunit epsilon